MFAIKIKNEQGKIKKYKYVNIKARESDGSDSKLLEEVNAFWHKHVIGAIEGLERKQKRLHMIVQMTEEQHERSIKLLQGYWKYEEKVKWDYSNKKGIDEIVATLKTEARLEKLPTDYILDYKKIKGAVVKELLNKQIRLNDGWLTSEGKLPKNDEIKQSVKDTIATYCNHRRIATKAKVPIQLRLDTIEEKQ